jgi:restriction system protein
MLTTQTARNLDPGKIAKITPEGFEKLAHDFLFEAGKGLRDFQAIHGIKMQAYDGVNQIDIKAVFALHDKIRSFGAHKGIIFSTSNFQQGAIDYAMQH